MRDARLRELIPLRRMVCVMPAMTQELCSGDLEKQPATWGRAHSPVQRAKRAPALHPRNSGRVRQVGPPLPLMQSSLPGKVRTSNPAWRRRAFVL